MQYDNAYPWTKSYKAITLDVETADALSQGKIHTIVRTKNNPYRGEIILVTKVGGERGGMIVGKATLVDIKKGEKGFVWHFEGGRRMIEFPAQKCSMRGEIWDLYYTRGALSEYPEINLRPILSRVIKNL